MRFRYSLFVASFCSIFLFLPSLTSGQTNTGVQVVFSRRVYKKRGRSFQQIWIWNPSSGALKDLTNSARNHFLPTCDGGKITFISGGEESINSKVWSLINSKLWSFDPASGEEHLIGPGPLLQTPEPTRTDDCDIFVKAGNLQACGKDEDLTVSRVGEQANHFSIKADSFLDSLEWSPDMKWLLVRERPPDYSGPNPQFDYYLVDLATMKRLKATSAFNSLWLPGRDQIVFTTSQDLAQLAGSYERHKRFAKIDGEFLNVWVQHLVLFDPVTGKSIAITSGITNNFDASLCSL
jgi:hypothetical protein